MQSSIFALALLATAASASAAFADEGTERTGSPYFLLRGGGKSDAFPLKETHARASVAGVIARVQVTQVYQNEGAEPIEAVYVFPGSTRSAVFGMRMKIGERTIEAKIDKREAARKVYEQAVAAGKTASLLEQHRPNVFQMNVGNILPGDRIEVVLDYTELLRPAEGVYEFVYPTVVGPRYVSGSSASAAGWNSNPYSAAGVKASYKWSASVKIAAGMTISAVTSPSHRISPRFTGKSTVQIETDDEYGGNRDYVLRYRLDGDEIETGLLLYEDPSGQGDNYFLLMAQPPKRTAPRAWVPREYIFVIDVSGSMSGFPLDTAKQIMRGLFAGLRTEDRFNMLFFSGGNQVMAEESVPATRENVQRAIDMLDGQRGGGGTELLGALRTALALPRRPEMATTVTVITDGYVTVEKETYALIRQSLGQASLFAFGTGSSVNRAIIEAMARAGMGEPFFALSPAEGRERAKELIRMVEAPLLSDVALELEGFDAYDVEPPTIPNLYASRPLIVFGKYRGRAGGELVIRGTDANGKLERTLRVADSEPSDDLVALRYLWARDRIERLSDDLSLAYDAETEKKITELGLSHRLMTAYTSFVAVDSQVRNRGEAPVEVRQPLPMPEGVSNQAIYGMSGFGHGGGASGSMNGSSMNSIGLGTLGTRGSGSGGGGFGGEGLLGGRGKSRELAISSGSPIVMGSLDKEVIRRVIRIHHGQIRYCYEKELLKNPGLGGKLVVELTIDAGGKVTKVEIKSSTMNNADVERCIAAKVQAWLFPKPAGGGVVIVRYPFVFRSE